MAQQTHVIKSGETPKQVADKFGVSVRELLSSNNTVLRGRWNAGVEVRDPKHIEKQVKKAAELGATAEQIAVALKIPVNTVVDRFGVLRRDELQEVPKETKQLKQTLEEIKVPRRAGKVDEVSVPKRSGRFPEIKVPERAKKILLEDIEVPERSRVPEQALAEIKVPERAKKILLEEVTTPQRAGKIDEVVVPQRTQKEIPAPYTDYESAMDQRLADVTTPERQLVLEETVAQEPVTSGGLVIPQEARDLFKKEPKRMLTKDIVVPKEAQDIFGEITNERFERAKGVAIEFGEGVTFGLLGELASAVTAAKTDQSYEEAKSRYEAARKIFQQENPEVGQIGTAAEFLGTLGTGVGLSRGLTKLGMYSLADQGLVEGVTYGLASGEGGEGRITSALLYGGFGNILGRGFDKLLEPSFVGRFRTIEEFNTERARLQEKLVKEARVQRAPTDITNEELATQLLLRDIEYLGDVVGRQGALPTELPSFYKRMVGYAEDMGVDMRQLNRVVRSNKAIKGLRAKLDEPFESLDDMALLRQDLLEQTTGRLLSDVGRTIPAAQDTIVRFRRLASPLATLAEDTVGVAFSQRLIRAMNRVTRRQTDLDNMWKGMEPFRELAETNIKFNDLLLDAVNPRLSLEFKEKSLEAAMNMARAKIGKGAPERLQKFFDDNIEFSKRYRREVTTGDVTPIWMHSSPEAVMRDASLRTYRDKAAIKAEDAASKNVKRPSMKKWREQNAKKPPEKQQEYANIFDSHWTWQRQTLTRMEIGQQLGFRTAGKPIVVGKNMDKKALKEGASELEATASYEAGKFRLFDDNIIEEALKREGYSDVQIKNAQQIIDDIGINANKGMASELEIVRSLGYVGTIANPYGALMNVHDLFNASFELGLGNVISAVFSKNGIRFDPADMGLARQVFGEFVRKARKGTQKEIDALGGVTSGNKFIEGAAKLSEDLLEWSMKWSGFAKLDQFGKSRIMGASFNRARQDIADGSFDTKWQYSFSKPEIDQLKRDIAAGNTDSELVRDLVMFDLFKLQPINAAAQTGAGLANPNARIFYMLKGFAIKQFDLMERRIVREWKAGNKKQALENLAKYIVISGGGYGVVNEARQVLKGEAPDPEEAAVSALYQVGSVLTFGAMGANDYGYDKFMNDPLTAMASNVLPPIGASLPGAVIEDIADAFRTGDPLPDETIYALPIVGKTLQGVFKE
jgi:LysM repeat protein